MSIERLHCRAARIIYNLPKDMASVDVLRHVQWPSFFVYYKLDVLRLFYRVHSKSLPDIMYENIGRNRGGTYFIRDQNRLFVPRYESRYVKDSLSYRGAALWNFVNYNNKEASATLNFNQFKKRVSSEDYFIDFKFECTFADNTILYIFDYCVPIYLKFVYLLRYRLDSLISLKYTTPQA